MKNADIPAMPIFNENGGVLDLTNGHIEGSYISQEGRLFSIGLTKREYFAGLAMQGLVNATDANGTWAHDPDCVASAAVDYANALLEALEKSNEQ